MLSCENTLPGAVRLDAAVNLEWSGTCRTCLQAGESRSIFELDQETQLTLVDKVMQCANVAIRVQDNLPDRICLQCVEELSVAYRFRTNCDSSNAVLQTYLANSLLEDKSAGLLTSDPEDGDEIAIHLDSGVMYTYKPPPGLNVRLVHRQGEDGNDNEDAIVLNSEPSIVTLDQQFENDQIFTVSSRQETQQDATDCKEEPLYESTAAEVGKIESNDAMDHLSSDRIQEDRHSTDEKTLSYMPLNNVKTLRTIRKTHAPNEVKPTIDAVTTQPAVDEGNEDRAPVDDIALSEMLQGALIAANDKGEPADEESAHLLVGWTLADVTLPTPTGERTAMGISDGASGVGTSVVTIVPDELENVSIVNFGDYMMKTDALDGLMVGDSTDDDGLRGPILLDRLRIPLAPPVIQHAEIRPVDRVIRPGGNNLPVQALGRLVLTEFAKRVGTGEQNSGIVR
uniref:ZAD domain-containing protein n=1 Tax=Anopheles dirus TaxID=7168 RepID=A0A182NST5_9DIPT